ncbi:hypothetical protein [Streptomyces malaysiensis]|uniref:Uncharacterized protein n=1 Tax=Streptomyces malaysiensis subsp. samsunensis TaxID=459658 RepID=A0A9X2RTJ8_STRMQ|nr:hypothetical protein [Streptomyces samsunensis]MCQ8830561.1 hypothetical protein [Streptomyces samsunensis]
MIRPAALVHGAPLLVGAANGATALTALLLSAIIAERNATRRQIERVCAQLTGVVFRLTPDERRPPEGERKSTDRR